MANICRKLRKKKFSSPVLKSPTHIGFIGVKRNGSKISHLGTFKCKLSYTHQLLELHLFIITAQHVKTTLTTFLCKFAEHSTLH
jgi:hypothetical protein